MRLHQTHILPDPDATAAFAVQLGSRLTAGDTLLLQGDIGAGKTTFARALIQSRLGRMEDVPSPTFTLVQTYSAPDVEIWHCDLYRLGDPQEIAELGLEDAFREAICLIEWPDKLGEMSPPGALTLTFAAQSDHHTLTLSGDTAWTQRLDQADV